MSDYPRYFKNTTTRCVYKFVSINEGKLHEAGDGVTRFPSDYDLKELAPHNSGVWIEVFISLSDEDSNYERTLMTVKGAREAKEALENDIQKLLVTFEKDTAGKVDEVMLDVTDYVSFRNIEVSLKVRI